MNIKQLKSHMDKVGVTVDEYDEFIVLDAPSGYVWTATGNTAINIQIANRQTFFIKLGISNALDSIKMGLEKVTDIDKIKEIRHLLDDDSWGAPDNAPLKISWK